MLLTLKSLKKGGKLPLGKVACFLELKPYFLIFIGFAGGEI